MTALCVVLCLTSNFFYYVESYNNKYCFYFMSSLYFHLLFVPSSVISKQRLVVFSLCDAIRTITHAILLHPLLSCPLEANQFVEIGAVAAVIVIVQWVLQNALSVR